MNFWRQFSVMARRSIVRTLRQPAVYVPTFILPLASLAVNNGMLGAAARLPGFPIPSYLSFSFSGTFLMAALFAPTIVGVDLAKDIRSGFLSRMALSPVNRHALLLSQLAGLTVVALLQALVFMVVGLLSGVTVSAGVGGAVLIVLLSILTTLGFGAVGMLIALRTGSAEAIGGVFALSFAFFFFSTVSMPRELITEGWFKTIAMVNPITYLVEAPRSLLIIGWDATALLLGFGIATLMIALPLIASANIMKVRLAR